MKEIIITENEAGQRLNKFLMKYLDQAPSALIYKLLRKKIIKKNKEKADGSEMIGAGDKIQLYLSDDTIGKLRKGRLPDIQKAVCHNKPPMLSVVYQDEHILVADKPENMLSQKAVPSDYSVNDALLDYVIFKKLLTKRQLETFRPSICNRLDRNTTGLILCSLSLAGSQEISRLIKEHQIEKYYLTIIKGSLDETLDSKCYLVKDSGKNQVFLYERPLSHVKCEEVHTIFEPVCTTDGYTLVRVRLITGKSHQIRAQLQFLGYAVIGDTKYGKQTVNQYFRTEFGLTHQLLHCYKLQFQEITGKLSYLSGKEITAELPVRFRRIAEALFPAEMQAAIR